MAFGEFKWGLRRVQVGVGWGPERSGHLQTMPHSDKRGSSNGGFLPLDKGGNPSMSRGSHEDEHLGAGPPKGWPPADNATFRQKQHGNALHSSDTSKLVRLAAQWCTQLQKHLRAGQVVPCSALSFV